MFGERGSGGQKLVKQGQGDKLPQSPKKQSRKPPAPPHPPPCQCGSVVQPTFRFCVDCGKPTPLGDSLGFANGTSPSSSSGTSTTSTQSVPVVLTTVKFRPLRPTSNSYDTSGLMQTPLGAVLTENKIDYKPTRLMTDYEFKADPHNILDLFREGVFSAVCQRCCTVLEKCTPEQFSKFIPVVALAIGQTPTWAEKGAEPILRVFRQRVGGSVEIAQAMHCLKTSRLLNSYVWGFHGWPDTITCNSGFPEVVKHIADKDLGYKMALDSVMPDKQIMHPFRPNSRIVEISVSKVFNSNAKPLLLSVVCNSNGTRIEAPIILKTGDDLRQDVSCLHVQNLMNNLWRAKNLQHDGLPVETLLYGVLAVEEATGCIEFVPHSVPLRTCKDLTGLFTPKALSRLITTAAGSFMAAYILGVRDRHFDNVLISKQDGSLFHIDFGHILGNECAVDTGAFAVTTDLKLLMSCQGEEGWITFLQLCLAAFKVIRENNRLVIAFASMVMAPFMEPDNVRSFMAHRLRLEFAENIAIDKMRKKLEDAPTRLKTRFKNTLHGIATGDLQHSLKETLQQQYENFSTRGVSSPRNRDDFKD